MLIPCSSVREAIDFGKGEGQTADLLQKQGEGDLLIMAGHSLMIVIRS